MIAERFRGDGTVTEEHLRIFVGDIETIYPHCEDLCADTDPESRLRYRFPLSKSFNLLIARDIDVYSFPRMPRMTRHIVGFEKIDEEIDPSRPIKVQTTYQVGVSTMSGLDRDPEFTREFVISHLQESEDHKEGWSVIPRQADPYYSDRILGVPVWHVMDLSADEKAKLEIELAEAEELDRLAEAIRQADAKPQTTDADCFNHFHGLLLMLSSRISSGD